MLTLISYVLLNIAQLIYVVARWVTVTREMIEEASENRLRRAIDWNA